MGSKDENERIALGERCPRTRSASRYVLHRVRVIERRGESALVEYTTEDGRLHRCYVPKGKMTEAGVLPAVLEKCIPYGVPWADMIDLSRVTPQHIEEALHRVGIWTADDLFVMDRCLQRIAVELISRPLLDAAASLRRKGKGK